MKESFFCHVREKKRMHLWKKKRGRMIESEEEEEKEKEREASTMTRRSKEGREGKTLLRGGH